MRKFINKRVSVGFSEEEYRVLRELSEQNGQPMAKIVSELVGTVIPILERMTANLKAVNNAPATVREGLRNSADSALSEMEKLAEAAFKIHDDFSEEMERAATRGGESVAARVAALSNFSEKTEKIEVSGSAFRASETANPAPLTNRGVKSRKLGGSADAMRLVSGNN